MITIVIRQTINGWIVQVNLGKTKGSREYVYATQEDVVIAITKFLKES